MWTISPRICIAEPFMHSEITASVLLKQQYLALLMTRNQNAYPDTHAQDKVVLRSYEFL